MDNGRQPDILCQWAPQYHPNRCPSLCSELDRKYVEESAKLIKNNSTWLPPLPDKCWEKGEFCVIRRLKILRPATLQTSASQELDPLNRVTLKSWGVEYIGNAADVLLKTISSYLVQYPKLIRDWEIAYGGRALEEIITVPICLREGYTGFPPPDVNLRNWFRTLSICPRNDATDRLLCFMSSLLNVTLTRLQAIEQQEDGNARRSSSRNHTNGRLDIKKLTDLIAREANPSEKAIIQRQELLAKTFRELMKDGQTFKAVNDYRRLFFDDIIAVADENFATVHSHLFDGMNPLDVGVFDSTAQSRPVIRMVFALASDTCEVTYATPERRSQRIASKSKNPSKPTKPSFTAYDFWCSGLDTKTFPIIHDRDSYPYKRLLARARKGDQLYDVESGSVRYGYPMR
ncbi:hypothetical protein BC826DRAFT_966436 [Russula brevipes]|nr:hypothetical protein BC826DRAFT_966436 [Russula brevipes]